MVVVLVTMVSVRRWVFVQVLMVVMIVVALKDGAISGNNIVRS